MERSRLEQAATVEGLPVSPSLGPTLQAASVPREIALVDRRVFYLSGLAIGIGVVAAFVAQLLMRLIWFFTQLAFYGRISVEPVTPFQHHLGPWVLVVPVLGGIVVGVMARYGSKAIRGHGIPEAMEQILLNQSRIPARMTFLKPISAAIAIGTGGPFGAEGPIIATGGALGSLVGQVLSTSASERKTLLAAGAAAGMAATFGSPVSAVLLAVELLLFEFRPRSMVPVALAASTAAGVRLIFEGSHPVFPMSDLVVPSGQAIAIYVLLGALMGVLAVGITRSLYAIEDGFERLPIHWMWWPALGGLAVGLVGYFAPRTLGVGYINITDVLSSKLALSAVALLCFAKYISWSISLGSGTSGGTLAPLFTIGSGAGAVLGAGASLLLPHAGVDLRIAALVGMASLFAGASRAPLTSVVFAFETTLQPLGLLPLLGGCAASFLVSCLLMRNSIMTEKIVRRGVRVPNEYVADFLEQVRVSEVMGTSPVTLRTEQTLAEVRAWFLSRVPGTSHQGFPLVNGEGHLQGVLTRRDLLDPEHKPETKLAELIRRPPVLVYADCSLREAADHMVAHDVGRLPVIDRVRPDQLIGVITRSDLLRAHRRRLKERERNPGLIRETINQRASG
jgi:H+/Cl- antiporter ClcA